MDESTGTATTSHAMSRPERMTLSRRCRDVLIGRFEWEEASGVNWSAAFLDSAPGGRGEFIALVLPEKGEEAAPFFVRDGHIEGVWTSSGSCTVVWVPQAALRQLAGQEIDVPRTIAETTLTRGVRALLEAVIISLEPPVDASQVTLHILEHLLVEGVLGVLLEAIDVMHQETGDGCLYERAMSMIRLNATNPRYAVAVLAADLDVSERQLQRVFAQRQTTPRGMLRSARIDLALRMLHEPEYDVLTLDQIGLHAGFADATAMRASFQRNGMLTPRRLRLRRTHERGSFVGSGASHRAG